MRTDTEFDLQASNFMIERLAVLVRKGKRQE